MARTRRGQTNIRRQIRTRKDGSKHTFWEARPYLTDSTGARRRLCVYGSSCTEVQEKLTTLRNRAIQNFDADRETLSDYLNKWLRGVKANRQPRTYELYEAAVRNHIRENIGAVRLGELRRDHIRDLFDRKLSGIGSRMRQIVYRVLSSSLAAAEEDDIILKSPCLKKDKPKHRAAQQKYLTQEESLQLLRAAQDGDYHGLFLLALTTGMRQGEIFGLQWAAVHLDEGYLIVRTQLTRGEDGAFVLSAPKASRERKIDLPAITIRALRLHRQRQQPKGLWVFTDVNGEPLQKDQFVRNQFHPLLKAAGLPRIRFYDLRHTAATLLLAAGENVKVVSERLGHSSAKMTLDVYAHSMPTLQKPAAAKIESIFSNGRLNGRLKKQHTV